MRAHQSLEKDMLGITAGARKKGKPCMRWMDDIKSVTGLSLNDLNQLMKDREKGDTLVYNIVRKRKQTNVKSNKGKAMANHSFGNAA